MIGGGERAMNPSVVLFVPKLGGGGAEHVFVRYANGLYRRGNRVQIIALQGGCYEKELHQNVKVIHLGTRMRYALVPLCRELHRIEPDLLLCGLTGANLVGAVAGTVMSVPKVWVSVHSDLRLEIAVSRSTFGRLEKPLIRAASILADGVIAVSGGVKDYLVEDVGVKASKIRRVYNPGYDDTRCREVKTGIPQSIDYWLNESTFILGAGGLRAAKGFDILLGSYSEAFPNTKQPKLIIIGEGPQRESLEKQVESMGLEERVLMPGFIEEPYPLFANAELFVLSSRWEGFGLVCVEALAAGTPVLTFDCPSGPGEIVGDLGAKYVVTPLDRNELAGRMRELYYHGGASANRCREVAARYSVRESSRRLANVLDIR